MSKWIEFYLFHCSYAVPPYTAVASRPRRWPASSSTSPVVCTAPKALKVIFSLAKDVGPDACRCRQSPGEGNWQDKSIVVKRVYVPSVIYYPRCRNATASEIERSSNVSVRSEAESLTGRDPTMGGLVAPPNTSANAVGGMMRHHHSLATSSTAAAARLVDEKYL